MAKGFASSLRLWDEPLDTGHARTGPYVSVGPRFSLPTPLYTYIAFAWKSDVTLDKLNHTEC